MLQQYSGDHHVINQNYEEEKNSLNYDSDDDDNVILRTLQCSDPALLELFGQWRLKSVTGPTGVFVFVFFSVFVLSSSSL